MSLSATEFNYVRRLVLDQAAIVLEEDKGYLVESRLLQLARREGFSSTHLLVQKLQGEPFKDLHRRAVEALTTNETSFFRDSHPFDALKKSIVPEMIAKRTPIRTFNIWCAACSSGQEPYTVAMLIRENFPQLLNWKLRILATDLSTEILERAREGRYTQVEMNRGLPAALLAKYFDKRGTDWQICDDIRKMVEFQILNLAGAWPPISNMDIFMLRNVLIYFSVETKKDILAKARKVLRPDGYLFLGASETTLNIDGTFERVAVDGTICYRVRKN
jgi:chemotaxis protein methyltransferase CheR